MEDERALGANFDSSVVQWLWRRTCDSVVVSSILGRRTVGRLVLGWVTVFGRAHHLGM